MNKFRLSFVLGLLITTQLFCQTKITGTVKSSLDDKTLYDATVTLVEVGKTVQTDRIGYFQILEVAPGNYTLMINQVGYEEYEQELVVNDERKLELGDIILKYNPTDINTGIITLSADELAADESSAQSSVGLLQASRDVFAETSAFEFGSYWFRIRGYENKYSDVLFNGVRMNKIDNDRVDYGNWGGLNDITRRPEEITIGLDPSAFGFGDVGGLTEISTRPSTLRQGFSLAYSLSNRSYRQRVLATYSSGLSKNGWAFTLSGARRWAEEQRIEGTLYDSWAYFAALEKKFNEQHTLVLTAFGAPYRRTSASPNTREVVDLKGIDYNAYWGWQDGEKRNERIRRNFEPIFQLTHYWKMNDKTKLNTTLSYQFGSNGSTRLDWYNAANPSPIYWRNLPSGVRAGFIDADDPEDMLTDFEQGVVDNVINSWRTDQTWSQIDWQDLYNQNYTVNETNEIRRQQGLPEIGAPYALVDDRNDDQIYSFHTNFRTELAKNVTFTAIANYQKVNSELYRELDDLLGGEFAYNNDDFDNFEFDLNNPGRRVTEGERYQYDFEFNRDRADIYVRTDVKFKNLDVALGMRAAYTRANRDGKYLNEVFQESSFGKSQDYEFYDFGFKGQLRYKLNGRNFLQLNGAYFTNAPTMNEIFPNARANGIATPNLTSEKITSGDLSYILRAPRIKARATAFYTQFRDGIESNFAFVQRGGDADANAFGALVTTGVDKRHIGTEIALETNITSTLSAYAVASIGNYVYSDNAQQYLFFAGDASLASGTNLIAPGLDDRGTTYIKDYKVAEGPQQAYSLGLEYRSPKYWWVGVSGNFLAANYVDIAHIRRTTDYITDFTSNPQFPTPIINPDTGAQLTPDDIRPLLRQERFSDEFMLNFNAGRTFRIGDYYAGISLNVNNVLNNKNYITGGFEQARVANFNVDRDPNLRQAFGNRHWYNQGLSYFLNLFLRF